MKSNYSQQIKHWFNYLNNRLPNRERYSLEKEMQRDPFLEDALEGYTKFTPEEIEKDLLELQKRITPSKKQRNRYLYLWQLAASILLIAGLGSVVWYVFTPNLKNTPIAQQTEKKAETNISEPLEIMNETGKQATMKIAESEKIHAEVSAKSIAPTAKNQNLQQKVMLEKLSDSASDLNQKLLVLSNEEQMGEMLSAEPGLEENEPQITVNNTQSIKIRGVSQTHSISGKVRDADTKEVLPGVNILSGNQGTISNTDGYFEITITPTDSLIRFAFVGMEERIVNINELSSDIVDIELEPSAMALEEVEVVGYGKEKRKTMGQSTETVKAEVVTASSFQGNVSGIAIQQMPLRFAMFNLTFESGNHKHCEPIGGVKNLEKYFSEHLIPTEDLTKWLIIEFTIRSEGNIQNIKIFPISDSEFLFHIEQLLNQGPEWAPATNNEVKVDETVKLEIRL